MKTVSKKFLEEQVRLALKENTGRVRNINEEDEGFDWGQLGREILIGADASWEQVIDLHNNTLRYGIGPQSHISRACLLYTSPSPRDRQKSRMPSSA